MRTESDLLYGRSGPHHPPDPDPDFPVVGTVRYELHKALDGGRCCIKRLEVIAICESRDEARQYMLDHEDEWGEDR